MNVLIIGSGGREHAIAWKVAQSPLLGKLYCAPGNPGIAKLAECVEIEMGDGFAALCGWCRDHAISLVIVGPERPLADGIVDALAAAGFAAFGPRRDGAQLEASKRFAKELMQEAGIPTGKAAWFSDFEAAKNYVEAGTLPVVIKASGLAEGKGVTVARTLDQALAALSECMRERRFGGSGDEVLVEEFLEGEEASLLAFTDGKAIRAMDAAQDHKPVFDGDEGPNTGGMGAYSPAPVIDAPMLERCRLEVLEPILEALKKHGIDYRGIIYAGLIVTRDGPKVIEFNCRFGDPETQVLLPRLKSDLLEIMLACVEGRLAGIDMEWHKGAAICVVLASGGYPGPYEKGKPIHGLKEIPDSEDAIVIHAGTARNGAGEIVTAGGRVLGVTVRDASIKAAYERAYEIVKRLKFQGMHYRCDIGLKALRRLK